MSRVKRAGTMLIIFVTAVALAVLLLWAFQRSFVYMPIGTAGSVGTLGAGAAEDVVFTTEDGIRLGAWFLPAPPGPEAATVIVFNGNAGNRSFRAPLAAALRETGCGVLLFDYRGFGGNAGRPSERGLAADARAARAFLASRRDVNPARLVYFGESLGTGVAVTLAAEHPPAGLILRSPFTSLAEVARRQFFFLPLDRMMWDRYRSIDRIAELRVPLLVIAGSRDTVVPFELSRRLYDAAGEPKEFVALDADHNDFAMLAGRDLVAAVRRFLESLIGFSAARNL